MSNVLSDDKRQQVLALGRLGWSLRRIEESTGVRRETAGAYLRAAGIRVRRRGGRPRAWPPKPATTTGVSTDSDVVTTPTRAPSASACAPYRELILDWLQRGRNATAIYQDLVDEFECTDGKMIGESPLYNAATPFANRDPRLVLNMRRVAEESWPDPQHPGQTGYVMRKYADFSHAPFSYAKTDSDQDMVWVRYADVLLMLTEATGDPEYLNKVRARAGVPLYGTSGYPSAKYPTIELAVEHERRMEFALEFNRWFDLKRTGRAVAVLSAKGKAINADKLLLPVPQYALNQNPNLQPQNKGY